MRAIAGLISEVIIISGRDDMVIVSFYTVQNNRQHFLKRGGTVTVQHEGREAFHPIETIQIEDLAKLCMMHKGGVWATLHPETQFYGASQNAEFILQKPQEPEK